MWTSICISIQGFANIRTGAVVTELKLERNVVLGGFWFACLVGGFFVLFFIVGLFFVVILDHLFRFRECKCLEEKQKIKIK
jgi:hypothetical protein